MDRSVYAAGQATPTINKRLSLIPVFRGDVCVQTMQRDATAASHGQMLARRRSLYSRRAYTSICFSSLSNIFPCRVLMDSIGWDICRARWRLVDKRYVGVTRATRSTRTMDGYEHFHPSVGACLFIHRSSYRSYVAARTPPTTYPSVRGCHFLTP